MTTTAITIRIRLTILFCILCAALNSQVVLEGKIKVKNDWRPYIYVEEQGQFNAPLFPVDSIRVSSSGSFHYVVPQNKIKSRMIRLGVVPLNSGYQYFKEGIEQNVFSLILPPTGKVTIYANADSFYNSSKISGASLLKDWIELRSMKNTFNLIGSEFMKESQKKISEEARRNLVGKYQRKVMSFLPEYSGKLKQKIIEGNDDYQKLLVMNDYYVTTMGNLDSLFWSDHLLRMSDTSIKAIRVLFYQLRNVQFTRIGMKLPKISVRDSSGKEYSISSQLKKINIIDFWASWCNPCRVSIRERLPRLIRKYSSDSIQFIGISVDKSVESWKKALIKDKPFWKQLIDNQAGLSFMELLKLNAFPTIVVADDQGVIIKQPVNEVELEDFLEEWISKFKKPALP